MTTVSINQPAYLPWLGYFDRILKSDIHVVLDHVQFEKNSMTNRNKIRTKEEWAWLTVPLRTKGEFGNLNINTIEIADQRCFKKHLQSLRLNYAKAPFFEEHFPFFEKTYAREWPRLNPLMNEITGYLFNALGSKTKIIHSADMGITSAKEDLVMDICKELGASKYISGPLGRDYLDRSRFEKEKIELYFHDYPHPQYTQTFEGFEPYMSVIDLLFNHGSSSREILTSPWEKLTKA